jgi:amphiphysin
MLFSYVTSFITPIFVSFYYMQLNVIYIMMEKLKAFCEEEGMSLDDLSAIEEGYQRRLGDAAEQMENMQITKRFVSTGEL